MSATRNVSQSIHTRAFLGTDCVRTRAAPEPGQGKAQPNLLWRVSANHGLLSIAPFAVGAVVHRDVEAQISRQHIDVGSLQADFAIRDGLSCCQ